MKKLMIAAFAIAFAAVAQAAAVDWAVSGVADDVGTTVYMLTTISENYDSVDAFIATTTSSAAVAKNGRNYNTGDQMTTVDSSIENIYLAVVSSDAKSIAYVSTTASTYLYNPDIQETSPGSYKVNLADIVASTTTATIGGGQAVPEPTSALMLLVGLAGLALKRKVA